MAHPVEGNETTSRDGVLTGKVTGSGVVANTAVQFSHEQIAFTLTTTDGDNDTISAAGHGLADGAAVRLGPVDSQHPLVDPFDTNQRYYVVAATQDAFSLAETPGGPAIDIPATGEGIVYPVSGAARADENGRFEYTPVGLSEKGRKSDMHTLGTAWRVCAGRAGARMGAW